MVGAVGEAEDIVQEAFPAVPSARSGGHADRVSEGVPGRPSPPASRSTTSNRRASVASYVGTWLPEPLVTDFAPDAASHVETADALSMAFLVLLERLTPVERAVFLLRDVFDFGFDEIAGIVSKSEDNCRQIPHRARRHVQEGSHRFEASRKRGGAGRAVLRGGR